MPQLGDLTSDERSRLQRIANQYGVPIGVFGSAAKATRRGIGTNLPLGIGPGTRSDLDTGIPKYMDGGSMEEDIMREFGKDIDHHGVLTYWPPARVGEIEFTPRSR